MTNTDDKYGLVNVLGPIYKPRAEGGIHRLPSAVRSGSRSETAKLAKAQHRPVGEGGGVPRSSSGRRNRFAENRRRRRAVRRSVRIRRASPGTGRSQALHWWGTSGCDHPAGTAHLHATILPGLHEGPPSRCVRNESSPGIFLRRGGILQLADDRQSGGLQGFGIYPVQNQSAVQRPQFRP